MERFVAPRSRKKKTTPRSRRVSRTQQPEDMHLEQWQRELRRQFGAGQDFALENLGDHAIFSDFRVTNPATGGSYRVAVRGVQLGRNFCSCPDFRTNNLGTCKHLEFTLAKLSAKRGGKRALLAGYDPPYSSLSIDYGARRRVRFRAGTALGRQPSRELSRWLDADGCLTESAYEKFDAFVAAVRALDPSLRIYDDVVPFVAGARDRKRRSAIINEAFPDGAASKSLRSLLKHEMYAYQKEGALFAARAGRSLIGDEMGLGKTIQAIAAAEIMARHFGVERVLVVCPTSLKHQWEREIESFSGRSTAVVQGLRHGRAACFATDSFFKITNYDTVYRDLDLIDQWSPDLVIVDEAQRIKNWNTRTAKSVKQIASPYAIVLTGTPLENRLEELVSIVEFLDPYRLGATWKFLNNHQLKDESGRVVGYRDLDRISDTLSSIVIRRRKREVLKQLPERLEKNFFVPMTTEQLQHHEENRELVARIVAKWRRYGHLSESDQQRMMIALQNMRMSCDSTYLLDHTSDCGSKADEIVTLLEEILEEEGSKVVVFSQWVRMHELLAARLEERGWGHVVFHGRVEAPRRKTLLDRFRSDPSCRLFLSTDAGGVGLNLQHASVVINVDLPWNPAVLEQRIGRVHRIGQKRPVRVVNFVAKGTIEEGMLSVLRFKKSLFAGVLDGGESAVFLGGSRLKRFMETVDSVASAIVEPEPVPEPETSPEATAATPDPLARLLATGLDALRQIVAAVPASQPGEGAARVRVERDVSGEAYLRVPMPAPETVEKIADALQAIVRMLGR